ncbi:hypothetical protein ABZY36_28130 [Streptomyces sp. NPDC006627]|uniref:hypothetical protein n=1 Tax=Streptomyces sp. NPDC006627 TaxID=3154679 RepID=UPI0033A80E9A
MSSVSRNEVGSVVARAWTRQLACGVRMAYAGPKVDDLPTYGWSTGIQVGSDSQVEVSSGQLKVPEPGSA